MRRREEMERDSKSSFVPSCTAYVLFSSQVCPILTVKRFDNGSINE